MRRPCIEDRIRRTQVLLADLVCAQWRNHLEWITEELRKPLKRFSLYQSYSPLCSHPRYQWRTLPYNVRTKFALQAELEAEVDTLMEQLHLQASCRYEEFLLKEDADVTSPITFDQDAVHRYALIWDNVEAIPYEVAPADNQLESQLHALLENAQPKWSEEFLLLPEAETVDQLDFPVLQMDVFDL